MLAKLFKTLNSYQKERYCFTKEDTGLHKWKLKHENVNENYEKLSNGIKVSIYIG